jgi:tetratricopeptide (TPR) repeat protein
LIGIARVKRLSGDPVEAAALFSDLITRYPDSMEIKKELTLSHFENRSWQSALPVIDEVLLAAPRNGEFILMKAFILLEQGNHSQSNILLDSYASIDPNNRMYLFLRARIQFEGSRNRDLALNYLRSILRSNPDDEEALGFAVALLLESSRPADHVEGRELLERMRRISGSSIDVLSLNMRDAIMRESWQEAQGFHTRILAVRRTVQDLIDGYHIERNLGNNVRALSFAQELYGRDTSNSEYIVIYISALIDNNRRDEASRLLDSNINVTGRGPLLSRFYFLRSRLQTNEDAALSDLRASLFEDPRNLDALIAIFQIYHRRREERRAVHYLRQALAIAPNHPLLQRFEREYAALLGRN